MQLAAAVEEPESLQGLLRDAREGTFVIAAPRVHDVLQAPSIHVLDHQRHTSFFHIAKRIEKLHTDRSKVKSKK